MTTKHRTGTRDELLAASKKILDREQELSRLKEQLAKERRELPWARVEKEYTLDAEDGPKTLAELFAGRSRVATGDAQTWQVVVAIVLMLAAIGGINALAARIYSNSVLRIGSRVRWADAWRSRT